MSSILTPYIRKTFESIDKLSEVNKFDLFYLHNPYSRGIFHSIYIKVDYVDYTKIYDHYSQQNDLSNNNFIMHSNNKIGLLSYYNLLAGFNVYEKWEFRDIARVYNYPTVDVAYSIDPFDNRCKVTYDRMGDLSVRYNASGHWYNIDGSMTMFIGKRVVRFPEFEHISIAKRINTPNYAKKTATTLYNIHSETDVNVDYFIVFRVTSQKPVVFNTSDINALLKDQKLYHFIVPEVNLCDPIV
nr:hypothetical protein MmNV_75 [Menippe mercenaria nudivirus]